MTEELQTQPQSAPQHITEFFQYQLEAWQWNRIAWGGILAATLTLFSTVALSDSEPWRKAGFSLAGLSALSVARTGADRAFGRQQRVKDIIDISNQGFTQDLYESMVNPDNERPQLPQAEEDMSNWVPKKLFDIYSIVKEENRTKNPHILILGQTGSGKTFLVKELIERSTAKHKIYVSPTKEEDEMNIPGMRYVGCGLNPKDNGNYQAIKEFFASSLKDIKDRVKMSKQQKLLLGFTECCLDEIPDIALEMPWSDWFLRIVSMARKQGFRLWVPTTGDQVKTLGIEGRGDMRDNLRYLRIGDAVSPHLQSLVSAKKYPQAVLDWYEKQIENGLRVFTFEDEVGVLPVMWEGYQVTKYSDGTRGVATPGGYEFLPPRNPFELQEEENLFTGNSREKPENPDSVEQETVPTVLNPDVTPEMITEWKRLRAEGLSKSKILKQTRFVGRKYALGSAAYDAVM